MLDGELTIALREDGAERTVVLPKGAVFVVPRGTPHRPSASGGASILMLEPSDTLSVGDRHDGLSVDIDATTGHALTDPRRSGPVPWPDGTCVRAFVL